MVRLLELGRLLEKLRQLQVKGALPGKPITAETEVTNTDGKVTSDKSKPVTPTPERDRVAPTVKIVDKTKK